MTKFLNPFIAYYDTNGEPISGGKLNFYEAGTTNFQNVYADSSLTTPLSNPVVADSDGRFPTMYMQKLSYKIILTDADDVTIKTVDNYDFTNEVLFDDIKQQATTTYQGVVELATTEEVIQGTDNERAVTPFAIKNALANTIITPQGFIYNLIPSNAADTDHDITISTGTCRNATNDGDINLETEITKQTDAVWQAGTDMGGMPQTVTKTGTFNTTGTAVTGTSSLFQTEFKVGDVLYSSSNAEYRMITDITNDTTATLESAFSIDVSGDNVQKNGLAPNATYHMFVINKTDGTVDSGYDTQPNAENLLADSNIVTDGYLFYRRIFSFINDSAANLIEFKSTEIEGNGCEIEYVKNILDSTSTASSEAGIGYNISVPNSTHIRAKVHCMFNRSGDRFAQVSPTTDSFPTTLSLQNCNVQTSATTPTNLETHFLNIVESKFYVKSSVTGTWDIVSIRTYGYTDYRI
jgi:hypothetical protein